MALLLIGGNEIALKDAKTRTHSERFLETELGAFPYVSHEVFLECDAQRLIKNEAFVFHADQFLKLSQESNAVPTRVAYIARKSTQLVQGLCADELLLPPR